MSHPTIEDYHEKLGDAIARETALLVFLQRFSAVNCTQTAKVARLQDEAAAILTRAMDRGWPAAPMSAN